MVKWLTLGASCEPYLPSVCECAPSECVCFWRHYLWPSNINCGTLRIKKKKKLNLVKPIFKLLWHNELYQKLKFTFTCAYQFSSTLGSDEEDDVGFSCAASMLIFLACERWLYPSSYLSNNKFIERKWWLLLNSNTKKQQLSSGITNHVQ